MTYTQAMRAIRWNDDNRARRRSWEPRFYVDIQRNVTPDGRGMTKHIPTFNEYTGNITLSDPFVPTAEDLAATDWEAIDRVDFFQLMRGDDAPFRHPNPNVRYREIRMERGVLRVSYWVPNLSGLRSVLGRLVQGFVRKPKSTDGRLDQNRPPTRRPGESPP